MARRLRTPVVLLSDKEVGMIAEVVDDDTLNTPAVVTRARFEGDGPFVPFRFARPEEVPAFAVLGGKV